MAVTSYRWDKIVKSVHTEMRWSHNYFGIGHESQFIVITWLERKHRSRKVKPMMGDDYRVSEYYDVTSTQSVPFTEEAYKHWVSQIDQPQVKHIPDDPVDTVGKDY